MNLQKVGYRKISAPRYDLGDYFAAYCAGDVWIYYNDTTGEYALGDFSGNMICEAGKLQCEAVDALIEYLKEVQA